MPGRDGRRDSRLRAGVGAGQISAATGDPARPVIAQNRECLWRAQAAGQYRQVGRAVGGRTCNEGCPPEKASADLGAATSRQPKIAKTQFIIVAASIFLQHDKFSTLYFRNRLLDVCRLSANIQPRNKLGTYIA